MKTLLLTPVLVLLANNVAEAANNAYAIGAYSALTTETVIVFGPIEKCDVAVLAKFREAGQATVPPSLTEIGYVCASRDQIARLNLNDPICSIVSSDVTPGSPAVWVYNCYRGAVDRFVNPPPVPTAAQIEQQREAQHAAEMAQQQATELAAQRLDERAAWQRYAAVWAYQRDRSSCLQHMSAHRAPGQDDPALLCDRSARNGAAANPTLAVFQFCTYLRSIGQPANTVHAACDTTAGKPFNVMPPTTAPPTN